MKLPWFNKLTTSGFFHCPFVLSLAKDERTPFSHTLLANQGSPAASIIETRRLRLQAGRLQNIPSRIGVGLGDQTLNNPFPHRLGQVKGRTNQVTFVGYRAFFQSDLRNVATRPYAHAYPQVGQ